MQRIWLVGLLVLFVAACAAPSRAQEGDKPGDYVRKMDFGGEARTYRLHIPPSYDGSQAVPLVVGLHGGGGSGRQFERSSEFSAKADEAGFIVVYPDGTGRIQTWNAGHCCGYALREKVDDVGFIRALVGELQKDLKIDPRRIYATGMSNGAMMTYWLGATSPDLFAAIAPVAGTIGGQEAEGATLVQIPTPGQAVSVIALHGMQDESVQYEGGQGTGLDGDRIDLSVQESINFWLSVDGCDPAYQEEVTHEGNIIRHSYICQPGIDVMLYTVVDGVHAWPGADSITDKATQDISATDLIWEFFASHPKP